MATYRITMHYDAYAETDIEANDIDEACDIAYDNLDWFDFEGEYNITSMEEIKK